MQNGVLEQVIKGEKDTYKIIEEIHRSEQSWLYLAVSTDTEEEVVIKEYRLGINPSWDDGQKEDFLKYFNDEVSVLKDIGGEGIPQFIDTMEIQDSLGRINSHCIFKGCS